MKNLFIDILAFGTLLSSVLVITSKNPVIAVIFLISVFVNAAGYLILLGIGFIGISYIIVYIGAITVLFLFIIMMISTEIMKTVEIGAEFGKLLPLSYTLAVLFLLLFILSVPSFLNNFSSYEIYQILNKIIISNNAKGTSMVNIGIQHYPKSENSVELNINMASQPKDTLVNLRLFNNLTNKYFFEKSSRIFKKLMIIISN